MELQFMLSARTYRYEILKHLENNSLDLQYLKLICENDEAYKSFHDLFSKLKGTTNERIKLINEVIHYIRDQQM